ncbi:MAG TPA: S9 family peptidase [Rudaea sp.]|nr:S9 family peptidase [Rudaea sp.]
MRVIALLFVSFAAATAANADKLTIDRIYGGGSLSGPTPTKVEISPDGSRVTFLRAKADDQTTYDLWEYNVKDRATRLLLDSKKLVPGEEHLTDAEKARRERTRTAGRHGFVDYTWAPDGKKLLFPLNGKLYIYDLTAKSGAGLRELATGGAAIDPKISPKGRYVSYVRDQNLWVIDLTTNKPLQLTHDGGSVIHNGEAEFIAEEELDRFTGYWWAPDDSAIAYERYDESKVALVKRFEIYADRSDVIEQRYPAAGKANVDVKLGMVAPTGGETRWIDLGPDRDIYLARAEWLPDSQRLSYQILQRNQKRLDLNLVDKATLAPRTLITETSDTWVNLNNDLRFLKQKDAFVWGSERTGFHHLYLYSIDGTLLHPISSGDWEIQDLLSVDEKGGLVYVQSNRDFVPDEQLYALRLDGSNASTPAKISEGDGLHAVKFGKDPKVYVDTFSNPSTPPQTSVHAGDGKFLSWIEENKLDAHHPYWPYRDAHIVPEFGTIEAADGQSLYYRVYKPLDFDPAKRYPVFDTYYGGPHGRVVSRGWADYFCEYMAQHGYVAFSLDNRGMADRGRKFSDGVYKQFGKLEVEDQIAGFHWLKAQPWVDPQRIGIFGWSYGGYMTAMLLSKASNEVAGGVAVAPVIDWSLYDTAYTERYLDTPQNNAQGYELSGVLHWLDGLKSPLLLIHGMADDNVQFTNSTKLMAALQDRGVQFELMTYPGGKHGLSTPAMRKHAFHAVADFFDAHIKKEQVENAAK